MRKYCICDHFSLTSDDSFEMITNEPSNFSCNGFGEGELESMELQGRIRQHRFESKRRNNKGGAVTKSGKRDGEG